MAGGGIAWLLQMALRLPTIPFGELTLLLVAACAVCFYQCHLIRIHGQLLIYLDKAAKKERLPMCLHCGYNLEGLPGKVCPECGKRIHGSQSLVGDSNDPP
jgi:hypothetical protein